MSVDRYVHKKGGVYDVISEGKVQTENGLFDMDNVVIYRSLSDGSIWVRGADEFFDGRFTAIARIDEPKDPIGYDVLMDLQHKLVAKIRAKEDHQPIFNLWHELSNLYPEADRVIAERWGRKSESEA